LYGDLFWFQIITNADVSHVFHQVIAVGPGMYDEEGNRKPINISPGKTVLYSKYAGNEFKSSDGSQYVSMRVSDVIAVMS
jgi:chaperonin GroES